MKDRATVLCVRDDRILLVARDRSRWALPGGRIRRDEAPHEAASRELEEETMLIADELMYGGLKSEVQHLFRIRCCNARRNYFISASST
jgi:ADP-ribose pyrophosphatase YjhB (NUDIX family)